jgi:hypothetical protein
LGTVGEWRISSDVPRGFEWRGEAQEVNEVNESKETEGIKESVEIDKGWLDSAENTSGGFVFGDWVNRYNSKPLYIIRKLCERDWGEMHLCRSFGIVCIQSLSSRKAYVFAADCLSRLMGIIER